MEPAAYRTLDGTTVPALTTAEMRDVDRVAVEEVGLDVVRMMEHAGRGLADAVLDRVSGNRGEDDAATVTVVAGNGGNGGGGLACARHLANRQTAVRVVLDREPDDLEGVVAEQLRILRAMDVPITGPGEADLQGTIVDAVIGYGLRDAPRGPAETLITDIAARDAQVVSLDVPSGLDATSGECPGVAVDPDLTVTLALPKTGLAAVEGDLRLVDLSIPNTVYDRLDLGHDRPYGDAFTVPLVEVRKGGTIKDGGEPTSE